MHGARQGTVPLERKPTGTSLSACPKTRRADSGKQRAGRSPRSTPNTRKRTGQPTNPRMGPGPAWCETRDGYPGARRLPSIAKRPTVVATEGPRRHTNVGGSAGQQRRRCPHTRVGGTLNDCGRHPSSTFPARQPGKQSDRSDKSDKSNRSDPTQCFAITARQDQRFPT
jgi:hypothetical protein